MDRIQRALDKARAQQVGSSVKSNKTKKENYDGRQSKKFQPLESIAYTQTRIVEVSIEQLESKRVIAGMYNNPQSSTFRMLRTQVLKKMRDNDYQTLAVTSPTSGEGKSLLASNLAVAIAMELNQTVLLVDMDLRNPSISDYFSLDAELGLTDYLERDIDLQRVLINPAIKRLVILPGRGRAENSAELLSGPKMASLVSDLKSQYDSRMIIFDVPPILQTDDVLLSSNYFDATLLVLEDGKNKEDHIAKSIQLIEGQNLIGTIVNKSNKPIKHQNY